MADKAGGPEFAQKNWNGLADAANPGGGSGDASTRLDATGTAIPGLKIWWGAPNTCRITTSASTPDQKLTPPPASAD